MYGPKLPFPIGSTAPSAAASENGAPSAESFDSAAQAKRNLRTAIENVSARLGNTPTICRRCYVHPEVLHSSWAGDPVLTEALPQPCEDTCYGGEEKNLEDDS
jgi:hypothetical protein